MQEALEEVRARGNVPHVYCNGFALGFTNADVHLILQLNGRPVQAVNVSYTLAKTLVERLSVVIRDFEQRAGQTLLTTDAVDRLFGDEGE